MKNTLHGAAKQYAGGFVNASGLASAGQGGTVMSGLYDERVKELDEQIKTLEATLTTGKLTDRQREDTLLTIEQAKQQRANYANARRSGKNTANAVYQLADEVANSGARDIEEAKRGAGALGRLAVDVGVAGAQMGGDIALGALTGGGALVPMFARSMGGSAQEARQEGASHGQQVTYGIASGALSVATEKIANVAKPFKSAFGGGVLDKAIDGALAKMNGYAAGKIALSFLSEGGEEMVEDVVQPVLKSIYNGKSIGQNYSELELEEVLYDGLIGGILGGLGGGIEVIGDRAARGAQTENTPTATPESAQERTETAGSEITLPATEERAQAAQETSAEDILRRAAEEMAEESEGLSGEDTVSRETAREAAPEINVPTARDQLSTFEDVLGESGRRAMNAAYQDGADVDTFTSEFLRAYHAGETGQSNPNSSSEISYLAYEAGKNDAATSLAAEKRAAQFAPVAGNESGLVYDDYVSTQMDSRTADEINTVAKALGVRVRMADEVRGGTANAEYSGSEIIVEKNNQNPVMQVVGHEWTHRVQELAPEQYRTLRDAVTNEPDVQAAAETLLDLYRSRGVDITYEGALDEATANYAGEMIANTDVLNDFIRKHSGDRTLLEKLRDALHELVQKLTGGAKKQAQTAEGMLQQAFEAATEQAEKNSKNAASEGGEVRYSLKGKTADGVEVYETSEEVKNMPYKQRMEAFMDIMRNEYAGRTAKFTANGNTYYARFNDADLKKNLYGDKRSDRSGWNAKVRAGADGNIFELVENATYKSSDIESGKATASHKGVSGWDYFIKTVQIDGQVYDLLANVRKKPDGEYVYSIQLNKNKNKAPAPPVARAYTDANATDGYASERVLTNASTGNVAQSSSDVKGEDRIRTKKYSLKEYSADEQKQHVQDAISYFGKTYRWNETGYLTPNGTKLDFSGRHEGAPGGYRTVDHRDIRDALGDDYGGDDYSGSMVQFMSEGNIRISPESGGIDLSVMPTKAQMDGLSDFISKNRGEVILDIDSTSGQTVFSAEYPRGTHANKVLNDIRAYFESGEVPQQSELAAFYTRDNYSLKGTEDAREVAALKRENEELRERVEHWKGQTRRSDGVTTDRKSVEKTAKALARDYGAEIDAAEISSELQGLYDYIARSGDESGELTYTEARRRADEIAGKIAESAVAKDDALYQDYADLRKTLKNTRLTLSAEDVSSITDYAEVRRGMLGKLNMAKGEQSNIDQVYADLADAYPEFFSEARDVNTADQLQRIMDVANRLYTITEYNPFEGDMGRAVAAISNGIMDRFFDLPQTKKTFADKSAEKLEAQKWRERERANTAIAKERARREGQLSDLRAKYREKDAARRESQKARDLRAKITRHASALSQKLVHPTDKQHIPEELRSAVAAVLNSINTESRYETEFGTDAKYHRVERGESPYAAPAKRTVAFQTLRDQCRSILAEGGDIVIDPSLLGGENVKGGFDEVIEMGDKRIDELSTKELETMWKVLRAVEHSVTTAGKMLTKGKYETTSAFAQAFRDSTENRVTKPSGGMSLSLENPYTFFSHYGEAGMDMYRMLRKAQDAQEVMARDVTEKVQRLLGEKSRGEGLKGRVGALRGNAVWDANAKTHEFTTEGGEKLTLTEAQQMEFYLLSKRKQALGHLLKGGIYQPEIRDAATGRVKTRRGTQATHLTQSDIAQIADSLTAEQKRIADGLQELTRTTLAAYGNEASMTAYGYRKFTESDYWPIRTAKEGNHSTQEKSEGNTRSIKNIGMAQQVKPEASNALDVGSIYDTFARHASDMIDYAAWLNPMEDANRVYNFKYRNGNEFKGLLDEKGGKQSQEYWKKLMGDIQNGIGSKDFEPMTDYFQRFVGSFKGAAVGANIRVVIQQPTAIFRAGAILSPADMAKGVAGGVTRGNGWEKAVAHSPIAMRKEIGGFDISSPYTLSDRFYGKQGASNKLSDLATAAAGKADAVTWGALWNACEWQVKREQPDLTAGSEAFYRAVNEVFSDVIDQSQVVDGVLQRSNIMRGKTLAQQATSFMGEPIMTMNMLLRAYDNFKYKQKGPERSAALKKFGRVATALVVTNTVNALAQSVIDGIRDDDKDKDYIERVLAAFIGMEGDEESGLERAWNIYTNGNLAGNMSLIGNVPFFKDIQSMVQGYDVARPDMETFSGLVNASKAFIESANGDSKKTRTDALLDLMAQSARMFGIPAANVKRDVVALLRTMATESGSIPFQYEVEKFTYNIESEKNRSRFISLLYDALEQGDYTSYEHIRDDLINSMGLNGQTISSSLRSTYDKKREKDEDYMLSQRALDLLGIREAYAEEEESDTFGADDLTAAQYTAYETQRADTYRIMENTIKTGSMFAGYSDEVKDKALANAAEYAGKIALRDNSGGGYEVTTKWVLKAETLEKEYGIAPAVYASLKAPISEVESLKDRDGESITYSKGLQIMEIVYQQSGLSDRQRAALFEAFNVPEKIRHYNKALVSEKLKTIRKKAK